MRKEDEGVISWATLDEPQVRFAGQIPNLVQIMKPSSLTRKLIKDFDENIKTLAAAIFDRAAQAAWKMADMRSYVG